MGGYGSEQSYVIVRIRHSGNLLRKANGWYMAAEATVAIEARNASKDDVETKSRTWTKCVM